MNQLRFEFIVFWDDHHWAAGSTTYGLSAYGQTMDEAVQKLKDVFIEFRHALNTIERAPHDPFHRKGSERWFGEAHELVDDGGGVWDTEPSKTERYFGAFEIRSHMLGTLDPRKQPVKCSLKDAEAVLSNDVYAATELFEHLEASGLVKGNGHHLRQAVVEFAVSELRKRWQEP